MFFLWVFALSIPFWGIGALTGGELLPGLPLAALMAVCPVTAALILVYRQHGRAGVTSLLRRAFEFGRIPAKIWLLPTLLILPLISLLSFALLRLTGTPVPNPQIALLPTLLLCGFFFIGALGEELGWSGYAIDRMQARWGAFNASLILGVIWAVWHYIPLMQAGRSLNWIAWWTLGTVAARVIIVWLYNHTGKSVLIAALFHMTVNVTWQLFPVSGSYFDPGINGLLSALIVVVILIVWEPQTLAQRRIFRPTEQEPDASAPAPSRSHPDR